ncbi:response regulator receiver and ANTAR domain protein [alpha proteobacterium BAL199]|nr:response regulator receiver and ANTAR domain protein [alpha proteobacterium BAL199]
MVGKRRVLVIEDEYLTAMDLTETLEELGFDVCGIARTEDEAVEVAALEHPDLITADVRLLDGDGITAVRRITAASPVPVVYISSSDADLNERAPQAIRVGKPFNAAMISQAIETALRAAPRANR